MSVGIRSEPGKGEQVDIFLLTHLEPGELTGAGYSSSMIMYPGFGQTGICVGRVEDFADCIHPIAVKVKDSVKDGELVRSLRDLADGIEAGVNLAVKALCKADWKPTDGWPEPEE